MKRREIHQDAIEFLRLHEHTGLLDHFGGTTGVIDLAEASDALSFVLTSLETIFDLAASTHVHEFHNADDYTGNAFCECGEQE